MRKALLLFIASINIFPQEFQITNVPVTQYSIDRYTNEIYYQHELTEEVFKTNSTGSYHILTDFPSVPQFANNSHRAAYVDIHQNTSDLYLYDFEIDSSFFLINYTFPASLKFSPSDDKILATAESDIPLIYYSFLDSSAHQPGITLYPLTMEWLSDSTILYSNLYDEILSLNINTLEMDTLVVAADSVTLRWYSYNSNINAFAYSWDSIGEEINALVNLHYLSNGFDTTVYDFLRDGPSLGGFRISIWPINWELVKNKLGFIGEVILDPVCHIYVFDYQSSKTYQYTNQVTGSGLKYNLQWLNSDTVIYSDFTDGGKLFGLDVTTPVRVFEDSPEEIKGFDLSSYPNPFNPTTKIKYTIPTPPLSSPLLKGRTEEGFVTLKVYDVLGNEIATLVNEEQSPGTYEVEFNTIRHSRGGYLPSGVYFYQIRAGNFSVTKKMILLK